ncbi:MAG: D-alanyl-D-alanine carboxypeptidase [Firmicutes bacterium]|nr:D-alanyl-D-alanine carboxypeptidase [Bacillota bacterium]
MRRIDIKGRTLAFITVICLFFGMLGGLVEYMSPTMRVDEDELKPPQRSVNASVQAPSVSAEGAVLVDGSSGRVLYEKNSDKRLYPASTTKIMTALVTLETLDELGLGPDSKVIVPVEAAGVEGSSLYLKAGEKLSLEELLYGLMLQSGNDSAEAIAVCVGGTRETFVEKMNLKAEQLGCSGTHFVNPSGLFDENHYTTAGDLAIIAAEAMEREDFREIVGAQKWASEETDRSFVNKNKTVFNYEGGNGVKIGFTKKSGRTLVASAEREGKELIAVVLRDGNWFNDAYALMDYGFEIMEEGRKG